MEYDFKNLRPKIYSPPYPPYSVSGTFEEYFYNFFQKNRQKFSVKLRTYIPIFWTSIYNSGVNRGLVQPYLDALPAGSYFTISQHDDAVRERLPSDTLSFEAGGNGSGIPIPLICSPIPAQNAHAVKTIFCSFVGSILPNSMRERLFHRYIADSRFFFSPQQWQHIVSSERLQLFIDVTSVSEFALCPSGYGAQSFRLYEALQLGAIPVVVYEKAWFPFADVLNWNEFAVCIPANEIDTIADRLSKITSSEKQTMRTRGREVYQQFFTLDSVCEQILKRI